MSSQSDNLRHQSLLPIPVESILEPASSLIQSTVIQIRAGGASLFRVFCTSYSFSLQNATESPVELEGAGAILSARHQSVPSNSLHPQLPAPPRKRLSHNKPAQLGLGQSHVIPGVDLPIHSPASLLRLQYYRGQQSGSQSEPVQPVPVSSPSISIFPPPQALRRRSSLERRTVAVR